MYYPFISLYVYYPFIKSIYKVPQTSYLMAEYVPLFEEQGKDVQSQHFYLASCWSARQCNKIKKTERKDI